MTNNSVGPIYVGLTYKCLLLIACVGCALSVPVALDVAIMFGSWTGAALLSRLAFMLSPVAAFLCIAAAARAKNTGLATKAIVILAAFDVPLLALVGLLVFHAATS